MSTFASLTVESPATSPRAGDSLLITGPNTKTTASQKTSKPGFFKRGYNLFFGSGNKASAVGQEDPGSPLSPNEQNCFFDDKSSELDSNGEIDDTWKQRSSSVNFIPELVGIDKLMFVSLILTQNHAIALYNHIPSHLGMQDMKLVYSMANDGSDLHTFYQKSKTLNNKSLFTYISKHWLPETIFFPSNYIGSSILNIISYSILFSPTSLIILLPFINFFLSATSLVNGFIMVSSPSSDM